MNAEYIQKTIEQLFKFNRCLLGEGYDNALEYLKHLIKLDILEFKSGTELGTWIVPDEWIVRDAWVKDPKGNIIINYKDEPLSLVVGSLPFSGKVSKEEFIKHLLWDEDRPDVIPYSMKFYEKDWGFCVEKNKVKQDKDLLLEDGEYEVFIDTEWKPGIMKLGVHTIPGKSNREILLFAHLDHPYQANDNLSSVGCLLDLAQRLKSDRTIKIIFCPETIGSQAYADMQDLSKVDFVLSIECCGNIAPIQVLKSWDTEHRLNRVVHCALQNIGKTYKKGPFRSNIGSDETVFNDPLIGIPGIQLSRWNYGEYHTNKDTPDKLDYVMIEEMGDLIIKIVEIWDKDYIPVKKFNGQLMRSRYGVQSVSKQVNLNYDYLFYSIDGKKSVAELCGDLELPFDIIYDLFEKLEKDGKMGRANLGKKKIKSPYFKEQPPI